MIVSKNWLAEYVQLPESVEDLTNRLTMSGLNLEEFHDVTESLSKPDVAIDIEVTSNRPDCLGHIGVAREVSVLYRKPLTIPDAKVVESAESCKQVHIRQHRVSRSLPGVPRARHSWSQDWSKPGVVKRSSGRRWDQFRQ